MKLNGNIFIKIFLLVTVLALGFSKVNSQTLTNYAKQHKAELAEKQRIEKNAYNAACVSGTIDAFRDFVRNFPKSKYVKDANSMILSLEIEKEKEAYHSVCQIGTQDAFNRFLQEYPNSQYAVDVQNRLEDFDLWSAAKEKNTVESYNLYLQKSHFKTFTLEARAAIVELNAASEWQNIKSTNNIDEIESFMRNYPNASNIPDAIKKRHELKGVQFYNKGELASAYLEFNEAGGKYSLSLVNQVAYDKCQEYYDYTLLGTYSKETELSAFLSKYPNSRYRNNVSNMIALIKARGLTMFSDEYSYKNALSYATDEPTRNQVKDYYEAKKREYSQYKKQQRKATRQKNGGIVNWGVEPLDMAFNPSAYEDTYNAIEYTMFYNVGLGIRLGNYKSPIQFEIGVKPGLAIYTLCYDDSWSSEEETNIVFHLPVYARLKIGLFGGYSSKWYIDGVGYYNLIKEPSIEGDYSMSVGIGISWRHWDWRILYYKQDIGPKETYLDYKFLGTSFGYYF